MRRIMDEKSLVSEVSEGKREAKAAFGKDEMYLEKLIERARHVEVQLIGDDHGNLVHLFERDCSVQRRNQKVVERAPAPYLSDEVRTELTDAALRLGKAANYRCAGTVEFLLDADTNKFYFIEVNPRHVRFYSKLLGFVATAGERFCERVQAPSVLLRLELKEQLQMFGIEPSYLEPVFAKAA